MKKQFPGHLPTWLAVVITAALTICLTGSAAWYFGYLAPIEAVHDHRAGGEEEEKQLWTCGMHPWIITEEPGQCPICGMDLTPKRDTGPASGETGERQVAYWKDPSDPMGIYSDPAEAPAGAHLTPVYEDALIGGVSVTIDPVTRQNMGLRTATVEKGALSRSIRTYGHITYDETRIAQVSLKFNGWIEKLHVDFTGRRVEKGDPLFDIYSPELLAAQEEYMGARRGGGSRRSMIDSARRRLSYFDVAESEIRELERTGEVKKAITIRSPFTGIVTQKSAVQGAFMKAGANLFTIADLSRVWVEAHIYEYELPWVAEGQEARMTLSFHPGRVYVGKVTYVYPYLQQKTRDVVARLEFENPDMDLKPYMFADVRIRTDGDAEWTKGTERTEGTEGKGDAMARGAGEPLRQGLIVPAEAVIRSGRRNIVFVERGEGKFTPREVGLGLRLDDNKVEVRSGLAPGEVVVTSGQFLLDSESKLKEAVAKMMAIQEPARSAPGGAADGAKADGTKADGTKADGAKADGAAGNRDAAGNDDFFTDMKSDEDDFFSDMKSE